MVDRVTDLHFQIFLRIARPIFRLANGWRIRAQINLSKRRRVVAVAVSLGLHGLLVAFLFTGVIPNSSGGGSGGIDYGPGTGSSFGVELVPAREAVADALKVKQTEPTNLAEATDYTTPQISTVTPEATSFDASNPQTIAQITEATTEVSSESASIANDLPAESGQGEGGQTSGVNDPLWKQIEPCWHRLAGPKTHSVKLRVNFSPLGNVAQTTDDTNLSSMDTTSRALATQALAECGPYVTAGSRDNVIVAFPQL